MTFLCDFKHLNFLSLAVLAFNAASTDPIEIFDGVHLDNEAYLLPAWDSPLREIILQEFLTLNVECQQKCSIGGIVFGVDVPFWLESPDSKTGEPVGVVTFGGERKSVDRFCIDLFDNVGIMNYRDDVYGFDSMLYHGEPILEYADSVGKSNVIMGLETYFPDPIIIHFPVGLPYNDYDEAMASDTSGVASNTYYRGYKMAILDDGTNIHVGLERPPFLSRIESRNFRLALQQLAQDMSGCDANGNSLYDDAAMLASAASAIVQNPEFQSFRELGATGCRLGFRTQRVILGLTTFGDETCTFLQAEMAKVDQEFAHLSAAYAGQALHPYMSLEQLCPVQVTAEPSLVTPTFPRGGKN